MQMQPAIAIRLRAMGSAHWVALFAVILLAWILLWAMSVPADLRDAATIFGPDLWVALCTVTPDMAGFTRLWSMWGLMAAAMMAPTAIPAFATYDELSYSGQTRFGAFVAGYLAVWLGFAALAAGLQMALMAAGLVTPIGTSLSGALSGGLLVLAGAYQFTALKAACLAKCRAPLSFFMQHWSERPVALGLRLGAVCLGCCWALMLLAFVGGAMSLGFMALGLVLMTLEKLPRLGEPMTRPLGAILIAGGAILWATSLLT